jgi:hypothetical protein
MILSSLDVHGSHIAHYGLGYLSRNSAQVNPLGPYIDLAQYGDPGR